MEQGSKISCGIFLFRNDNKFLIGHPTGFKPNTWSIPKGRPNAGEIDYFETAKRELLEETGIDFDDLNVTRIEEFDLIRYRETNKYLKGFFVKVDSDFSGVKPRCDSMVYRDDVPIFPEFDDFRWVTTDEARDMLNEFQYSINLDKCSQLLTNMRHLKTFEKYKNEI